MFITEDNFLVYAMKSYDNAQCLTIAEFEEDLKRFTYLKKLLFRYHNGGALNERIILNHITVIFNVFGVNASNMLFFKIEKELWTLLITFLTFLNLMPEYIHQVNISKTEVKIDERIFKKLKTI